MKQPVLINDKATPDMVGKNAVFVDDEPGDFKGSHDEVWLYGDECVVVAVISDELVKGTALAGGTAVLFNRRTGDVSTVRRDLYELKE